MKEFNKWEVPVNKIAWSCKGWTMVEHSRALVEVCVGVGVCVSYYHALLG